MGFVAFKAYFLTLYDLGCLSEALPRSPGTMKATFLALSQVGSCACIGQF